MRKDVNVFVPHSFDILDVAEAGQSCLIKTCPSSSATGYRNTLVLSDHFMASWAQIDRATATEDHYDSNGGLKINVRLGGASVLGFEALRRCVVPQMSCTGLLQPRGSQKIEVFETGNQERSVTISCSQRFLVDEIGLVVDDFSGPLRRFLETGDSNFALLNAGYSLELKQAAEAFFESEAHGEAFGRRLLLQARALDIVRLFLERMRNVGVRSRTRPRDHLVIAKVLAILENDLAQPPPVAAIAASVGVSQSKLMKLFKTVAQRTISECLIDLRMRRAIELIRQGDLSITQIAFEVGYEHSANFSTAFRRVFGMSPREAMANLGRRHDHRLPA